MSAPKAALLLYGVNTDEISQGKGAGHDADDGKNIAWRAAANGDPVPDSESLAHCARAFQYLLRHRNHLVSPAEFRNRANILMRAIAVRWAARPIDKVVAKMDQLAKGEGAKPARAPNPYDGMLLAHIQQALIERYTPKAGGLQQDRALLQPGALLAPAPIEKAAPAHCPAPG